MRSAAAEGLAITYRSDDDGGDFELPSPESVEERVDDTWIEVSARSFGNHIASFEQRHRLAIGAIAGDGVVDVGHRDDACFDRDILATGRVVAGRVEFVMVREHNRN